MDSPSVFGAMLDRDAGRFRLAPAGVRVPAGRRYLPGTMVLETSWGTRGGWIVVRDVLLIGPWHHEDDRSGTHRRAPTDYDADHVLLRTVRCVNGQVQVAMECEPMFDYGRVRATWEYEGDDYHATVARAPGIDVELRLTTDLNIGLEGPRATARHLMKAGETLFCALSWSEHPPPRTIDEANRRLTWTAHHWQHWLDRGNFPDHPWRSDLQRSALTLKGLTYAPTGAIVAAPTTSLPETPGGERNWDYRYAWIRDATFALWGLYTLGFDWEANDFFYFVADVTEAEEGHLQIMYGIDGRADLPERTLDHLSGYENARPVRVGNAAHAQHQHDVWGAVLDSLYLHTRSRDHLPERFWPMLCTQVEQAAAKWREPDYGIWEVRGETKHFTSSKLMCWVAMDRGARLAELREDWDRAARWRSLADEIHADICANAIDHRGAFTQHYDTTALDASVLLMPLLRFLPPNDPRIRTTVLAVADELTDDGLVLRYRVGETDDGLSGEEGTFTICSFLARVRPVRDRRDRSRPRPVREAARLLQRPRSLRRGDRHHDGPPPRQLPAGLHAPGPDQRRHARDPRRGDDGRPAVGVLGRPRARRRAAAGGPDAAGLTAHRARGCRRRPALAPHPAYCGSTLRGTTWRST